MIPITATQLAAWLEDRDELAILDLREQGVFAQGHLLLARSLPLSTLDLKVGRLVPRKTTRIVLCGDDACADGAEPSLVERGRQMLNTLGYGNVTALAGGHASWKAAGFGLFSGIYVPSKAFGEVVEHHYGTPSLTPQQLNAMLSGPKPIMIFDSRPPDEFKRMSIPGAVDCPGAELVYRVPELVPSADTIVVVNCAGRTRSIIGAQTLINAGLTNPVFALRNGTMGWELAGYAVERGKDVSARPPSPAGLAAAQSMAESLASNAVVKQIGWADYERMTTDPQRSSYLFDVRSAEEFAAGHPEGAVHAPGGQLVQATDSYIGTLRGRIVLFDDKGVRDVTTAAWLILAGWKEVFVLRGVPDDRMAAGTGGQAPQSVGHGENDIAPEFLADLIARDAVHIIDLATSAEHLNGHIPGARFAIRSRLSRSVRKLEPKPHLVLTSPDGTMADRAYPELIPYWRGRLNVLAGGTASWRATGGAIEPGFDYDRALEAPEDLWHTPSSFFGGGKSAMQEYIDWETGLISRIRHEPGLHFGIPY